MQVPAPLPSIKDAPCCRRAWSPHGRSLQVCRTTGLWNTRHSTMSPYQLFSYLPVLTFPYQYKPSLTTSILFTTSLHVPSPNPHTRYLWQPWQKIACAQFRQDPFLPWSCWCQTRTSLAALRGASPWPHPHHH